MKLTRARQHTKRTVSFFALFQQSIASNKTQAIYRKKYKICHEVKNDKIDIAQNYPGGILKKILDTALVVQNNYRLRFGKRDVLTKREQGFHPTGFTHATKDCNPWEMMCHSERDNAFQA